MFIYQGQFFLFDNRYSRDTLFNADVILVILLLITLYLLITVARQKYQLQRIQRLESDMQLGITRTSRCSTGASAACATIFPIIWLCRRKDIGNLC
ncbi:MAG: hypothetical protein V8R50_07670 [Clostridia bacterium]